jgi:hypothetical protein
VRPEKRRTLAHLGVSTHAHGGARGGDERAIALFSKRSKVPLAAGAGQ